MSDKTSEKDKTQIIKIAVPMVVGTFIIIIAIILACYYRGNMIVCYNQYIVFIISIIGRRNESSRNPGSHDRQIGGGGDPGPQDQQIEGGENQRPQDPNDRENKGAIPLGGSSENTVDQGQIEEGKLEQEQGGFASVNDNRGTIFGIQESAEAMKHCTLVLISESVNSKGKE